jgi:hypothetical protein
MTDGTTRPDVDLTTDYDWAPWCAEVVITPQPYQCMVSGRTGSRIALRLTHRLDETVDEVLIAPAVLTGVISLGLRSLERVEANE